MSYEPPAIEQRIPVKALAMVQISGAAADT
jgi:hypothetical protein